MCGDHHLYFFIILTILSMMNIIPNAEIAADHASPNPSALPWSLMIKSAKRMMKITIRKK